MKLALVNKSSKTLNNILSVLGVLLKKAVEWGVIDHLPATVRLLPVPMTSC